MLAKKRNKLMSKGFIMHEFSNTFLSVKRLYIV